MSEQDGSDEDADDSGEDKDDSLTIIEFKCGRECNLRVKNMGLEVVIWNFLPGETSDNYLTSP